MDIEKWYLMLRFMYWVMRRLNGLKGYPSQSDGGYNLEKGLKAEMESTRDWMDITNKSLAHKMKGLHYNTLAQEIEE